MLARFVCSKYGIVQSLKRTCTTDVSRFVSRESTTQKIFRTYFPTSQWLKINLNLLLLLLQLVFYVWLKVGLDLIRCLVVARIPLPEYPSSRLLGVSVFFDANACSFPSQLIWVYLFSFVEISIGNFWQELAHLQVLLIQKRGLVHSQLGAV